MDRQEPRPSVQAADLSPQGLTPYPVFEVLIGSIRTWATTISLWNLALDPKGGPVQPPNIGCPHCSGVVTMDERQHTAKLRLAYYQLGRLSRFVQPGAGSSPIATMRLPRRPSRAECSSPMGPRRMLSGSARSEWSACKRDVLAWALWSLDRVVEARDAAEQAVLLLEHSSDVPALAHAHATHIRIQATAFDPHVAIDDGPRALELAAGPGLEETRIGIQIIVALARGHRGDAGALDALSDACRAAREAGLTIQTVRASGRVDRGRVGSRRPGSRLAPGGGGRGVSRPRAVRAQRERAGRLGVSV